MALLKPSLQKKIHQPKPRFCRRDPFVLMNFGRRWPGEEGDISNDSTPPPNHGNFQGPQENRNGYLS